MKIEDENEIFENNIRLAYMVANRYKNYPKEKEDITQIALEGLWTAAKKYDENRSKFTTFAVSIMSNKINYYLRSVKKERESIHLYDKIPGKTENIELIDVLSGDDFDIEEIESKIIIQNCLNDFTLSDKERTILKYWLEGKKQDYIASVLSISQASVSRIVSKIINKLKKRFNFENRK